MRTPRAAAIGFCLLSSLFASAAAAQACTDVSVGPEPRYIVVGGQRRPLGSACLDAPSWRAKALQRCAAPRVLGAPRLVAGACAADTYEQGTYQCCTPLPGPLGLGPSFDFESGVPTGWTVQRGQFERNCRAREPRLTSSEALPAAVKPTLGGDYWRVPMEPLTNGYPHGCLLQSIAGAQATLVSEELTVPPDARFLHFTVAGPYTARVELQVKLRQGYIPRVRLQQGTFAVGERMQLTESVFNLDEIRPAAPEPFVVKLVVQNDSRVTPVYLDTVFFSGTDRTTLLPTAPPALKPPLFGFADLHTHFFTDIGNGGRLFAGRMHSCISSTGEVCTGAGRTSKPEAALGDCQHHHGSDGGDGVVSVVPEQGHHRHGWPDFKGWPHSGSVAHQQMYIEWLRRAHAGGLRLVHMDVSNNAAMAWAYSVTGGVMVNGKPLIPGPLLPNSNDDDENIRKQAAAAVALAQLPDVAPWLELAFSPADARRIIGAGKLAVVLGAEVDDFGGFNKSPEFWARAARAEADVAEQARIRADVGRYLDGIHALGIRHFFPIHVNDSPFGGAALYELLPDAGNYIFTRFYSGRNAFGDAGVASGRFLGVRNARPEEGILSRIDLEYRDINDKVVPALKGASIASDVGKLRPALPLVMPLLSPVPFSDVWLPWTVSSVGLAGDSVLELDRRVGLSTVLNRRMGELSRAAAESRDAEGRPRPLHGFANARGLTKAGEILVEELMKRGMLIDLSHASELATHDVLRLATRHGYPMMSGHTGFRETSFGTWRGTLSSAGFFEPAPVRNTQPFDEDDTALQRALGTANPEVLANERGLSAAQMKTLLELGGMVGIGTGQGAAALRQEARISPDCDGSTKAFAQHYLYAVKALKGRGIALGTDANGFVGGMGPRFGPKACSVSAGDAVRQGFLTPQAERQMRGVRYRQGLTFHDRSRFLGPTTLTPLPAGGANEPWDSLKAMAFETTLRENRPERVKLMEEEQAVWVALTRAKAGDAALLARQTPFDCNARGFDRDATRLAWGFLRALHGQPRPRGWDAFQPGNTSCFGDQNSDSQAAWDVAKGGTRNDALRQRIGRVWDKWHQMQGPNPPLEKLVTSTTTRDFDFNVDGLANYGLLPDMLQDLRNAGLTPDDLAPLFRGAEDYVQMWERIEVAKANVR